MKINPNQKFKDISLFVAIPCPTIFSGCISPIWSAHLYSLNLPRNTHLTFDNNKWIDVAQNKLVRTFMESDYDYMLLLATDNISVQPDAVKILYDLLDKYDFVGGLYFMKEYQENYRPLHYKASFDEEMNFRGLTQLWDIPFQRFV